MSNNALILPWLIFTFSILLRYSNLRWFVHTYKQTLLFTAPQGTAWTSHYSRWTFIKLWKRFAHQLYVGFPQILSYINTLRTIFAWWYLCDGERAGFFSVRPFAEHQWCAIICNCTVLLVCKKHFLQHFPQWFLIICLLFPATHLNVLKCCNTYLNSSIFHEEISQLASLWGFWGADYKGYRGQSSYLLTLCC